jgi:hypothetical protein
VGGEFTAENAEIAETKSNLFLGALGVLSEASGYKIFNRQDAKSAKKGGSDFEIQSLHHFFEYIA